MRCSIYAAAAALLLSTSTIVAGGLEANRASYRNSSASHWRGASTGCGCGVSVATTYDSADSACGTCQNACTPLLPRLMSGLDCMLHRLYFNPCNMPCCRPRPCRPTCCAEIWQGYPSGCGCDSGGTQNWLEESTTDPFVDDELKFPPPVPKDARLNRPAPRSYPIQHRRPQYSSKPTTVAPVKVAVLNEKIQASPRPAVAPRSAAHPVKQVKHEMPAKRTVPKNELRDE